VQRVAPDEVEYIPTKQLAQVDEDDAPVDAENLPAAQASHSEDPAAPTYLPAPHKAHALRPIAADILPTGHNMHSPEADAPVVVEKEPIAQPVQDDSPSIGA